MVKMHEKRVCPFLFNLYSEVKVISELTLHILVVSAGFLFTIILASVIFEAITGSTSE